MQVLCISAVKRQVSGRISSTCVGIFAVVLDVCCPMDGIGCHQASPTPDTHTTSLTCASSLRQDTASKAAASGSSGSGSDKGRRGGQARGGSSQNNMAQFWHGGRGWLCPGVRGGERGYLLPPPPVGPNPASVLPCPPLACLWLFVSVVMSCFRK